jgi:hypothetical protein
MANYYVDLDLLTSGGTGLTTGDPFNAIEFQTSYNSSDMTPHSYEIKGSYSYSSGLLATPERNLTNWGTDPYRISCTMFNPSTIVKNGIITTTTFATISSLVNCFVTATTFTFYNFGGSFIKGSTLVGTTINSTGAKFYDSVLKGTCNFNASSTSDHCVFTGSLPNGTHTFSQANWSAPTWPAWDDARSNFSSTILGVDINTPDPGFGVSPYTGYETGLWGTPRTGTSISIGAMDFESGPEPVTTCWNFTAMFKGTKRFFKLNGPGNCPTELIVPKNVDLSTGIMMEHGKKVNFDRFKIL